MSMFFVLRNESIRRADSELKTAIALDPNNSEAFHFLAHTSVMRGHYRAAEFEEQTALRLDPMYEISRAHLVHIYSFLGDLAKAEEQLVLMMQQYPGSHLPLSTRGWLYWTQRRWSDAVIFLEQAKEFEPNISYLIDHLSDCYRRMGHWDKACEWLEAALKAHPGHHFLEARLAQVLSDMGECNRAAEHFQRAHTQLQRDSETWLNPASAVCQYNRAWIYALEGKAEPAFQCLRSAVDEGYGHLADFRTRPDWDVLQSNDQFQSLIVTLAQRLKSEDQSQ